ncbi:hypothetical protein VULLAG_LOCUS3472 [Vulpes lagopus]
MEGETVNAFGGAEVVFLKVVALEVGVEDLSVVDRKRKCLPGRGHSQGRGEEAGSTGDQGEKENPSRELRIVSSASTSVWRTAETD